jgi:hypothetical protein
VIWEGTIRVLKRRVNGKENSQKIVRKAKGRTWAYRTIKGTFGYYSGHPMTGFLKRSTRKRNDTHNGKFISHLQEKRSQVNFEKINTCAKTENLLLLLYRQTVYANCICFYPL